MRKKKNNIKLFCKCTPNETFVRTIVHSVNDVNGELYFSFVPLTNKYKLSIIFYKIGSSIEVMYFDIVCELLIHWIYQ